ncbi:MAG: hypothetical protein LBI12_03515 [Treponema sp.]|jgi:hypothetical protein|nr:hypothetical protein [Treponema sp.]
MAQFSSFFRSFLPFLLLFCAAAPVMSQTFTEGGTVPLDRGAFLYILTDVNRMRPVIDILPIRELKNWQALLVLDRTDTAATALYNRASGRHFQLAGWGNYPSFTASIALFLHRNWKLIHANTGSYWFSDVDRLSVRIASRQIYALAWRTERASPVPLTANAQIPEGFINFRNRGGASAPLSLWMENPASMLNMMFLMERIRLRFTSEKLYLNLYPDENNLYKADLRLLFENHTQAREFTENLYSINYIPSNESNLVVKKLFFATNPVLSNRTLDFYSDSLSESEIIFLLNFFLSYWRFS